MKVCFCESFTKADKIHLPLLSHINTFEWEELLWKFPFHFGLFQKHFRIIVWWNSTCEYDVFLMQYQHSPLIRFLRIGSNGIEVWLSTNMKIFVQISRSSFTSRGRKANLSNNIETHFSEKINYTNMIHSQLFWLK